MILNLNLMERLNSCGCDKIRIFPNIFWDADLFNYACKATRTNHSLQATAFPQNLACQVHLLRLFVVWLLTHQCQLMLYPLSNPCLEHVHEGRALMATTTVPPSLLMYPTSELSWTLFTLKNGSTNYCTLKICMMLYDTKRQKMNHSRRYFQNNGHKTTLYEHFREHV